MAIPESLSQEVEAHRQAVLAGLEEFKRKFAVQFIVSISGGAEDHNRSFAEKVILELIQGLEHEPCAILTGGTQGGIPELGTTIAKSYNLPTIAVYPHDAIKYVLFDQIDLPIETLPPSIGPASFGSETPTFAQLPDFAVYIGGLFGTLSELSTMLKINTKRIKHGESPIYLLPVSGSDKVTQLIPTLVQLDPQVASCLPDVQLTSGTQIAEYIKENYKHV